MKLNEIIRREGSSSPYEKGYEDMHPDAAKEMVKKTEALIKKLTDGQGWTGGPSGTDAYNRDWKKNIAKEKKRLMMFKKLAARKVTEDMMGGPFVNFLFGLSGAIDNLKWWFDKGEGPAWWTSEYKKNQDYDMKTWRQGPYEKGPKPGGIKNPKWAIIWWMAFYIQNEADGKETPANIAKAARNVFKFLGNKIHYTKDKDEVIKAMIDLYNEKKEFAPHMEVPERDKKKKWYNKLGESSDKDYNDLYNHDWKKEIVKEKKRLAMFKKLASRKVTEQYVNKDQPYIIFVKNEDMKDLDDWLESEGLGYDSAEKAGSTHMKVTFTDSLSAGYAEGYEDEKHPGNKK